MTIGIQGFMVGLGVGLIATLIIMINFTTPSNNHYDEVCALRFELAETLSDTIDVMVEDLHCVSRLERSPE